APRAAAGRPTCPPPSRTRPRRRSGPASWSSRPTAGGRRRPRSPWALSLSPSAAPRRRAGAPQAWRAAPARRTRRRAGAPRGAPPSSGAAEPFDDALEAVVLAVVEEAHGDGVQAIGLRDERGDVADL